MAEQASGGVTIKSYSRARRLLDFMKLPAWLLLGLAAIVPLVQTGWACIRFPQCSQRLSMESLP